MHHIYSKVITPNTTYQINLTADEFTTSLKVEKEHYAWVEYSSTASQENVAAVQFSYISGLVAKYFYPKMSETLFLSNLEKLSKNTLQNWLILEDRYDR
ncbi:hypothetical protein JK159_02415 [Weissella minor]|uniref:hypothetical protein n=1 Tax=Weissella minor TaxID=1620 RepID=UPI001BAFC64A|nr:hypothetical protein [Weissella minor]MBS0949237.1 hypothetical protein [Weissella minor]